MIGTLITKKALWIANLATLVVFISLLYAYDQSFICAEVSACYDYLLNIAYLAAFFNILTLPFLAISSAIPSLSFSKWARYSKYAVPGVYIVTILIFSVDFGGGLGGTVGGQLQLAMFMVLLVIHYVFSILYICNFLKMDHE